MSSRVVCLPWLLAALILTSTATADPPLSGPPCNVVLPPLYGLRVTHLDKVMGQDHDFRFMFEVLNGTSSAIAGVVVTLNTGGDEGGPELGGGGIDANGRPFGAEAFPPAGNSVPNNDWTVIDSSASRICFAGGTAIVPPTAAGTSGGNAVTFTGFLDPQFAPPTTLVECVAALTLMIPGSEASQCGNAGVLALADVETADDGDNTLDGFWIRIDDFTPGSVVSFNFHFLDASGNVLGIVNESGSVFGSNNGIGAINLYRFDVLDPVDEAPGALFESNTGFNPGFCGDSDADNPLFWAEDQDPVTGIDGFLINPIPPGTPGQGECFAVEFAQTITAQFQVPTDAVFQFEDQIITSGFNTGSFSFAAPDGVTTYDTDTGEASFSVILSIRENAGNDTFPTCTQGFSMALRHDEAVLTATAVNPAGALLDLQSGMGPDFFGAAIGDAEFTLGVIYDLTLGETLSYPDFTEVVEASYSTVPSGISGNVVTTLTWANLVTIAPNPPLSNQVVDCTNAGHDVGFRIGTIQLVPDDRIFVRGDCVDDGIIGLQDAVVLLFYMFCSLSNAEPSCLDACDMTDDGILTIADPINLLAYLFTDGSDPAAPFPACGLDPTPDEIPCGSYDACP